MTKSQPTLCSTIQRIDDYKYGAEKHDFEQHFHSVLPAADCEGKDGA